jgi:hypothetical protein
MGALLTCRSAVIPAVLIAGVNAYNLWNAHWAHWEHLPPLEERPEYPYQNIRTKNFFWGDGDKVSDLILHFSCERMLIYRRLLCKYFPAMQVHEVEIDVHQVRVHGSS